MRDTIKHEMAVIPSKARYFNFYILLTMINGTNIIVKQIPVTNHGWKYQLCSRSGQNDIMIPSKVSLKMVSSARPA